MRLFLIGVIAGLGTGAIYVILGLSYNLVLAVSGIFNFAQGSILMAGTFLAYGFLMSVKMNVALAIILAAACGVVAGYFCELVAVRPLYGRTRDIAFAAALSTLGLGLVAENLAASLFSSNPKTISSYISTTSFNVHGVPVQPIYIVTVGIAVIVSLVLEIGLSRSTVGHRLRACLEDRAEAELHGIDTQKVVRVIFAIAGLLAVLAGFLIAPVTSASPFVADDLGFYAFAGMAIGGFASFRGALVGGTIVGLISGIVPVYISANWTQPLIWLAIVATLVIRPRGLFGYAGLFGAKRAREA